jgi:hypothetical protein
MECNREMMEEGEKEEGRRMMLRKRRGREKGKINWGGGGRECACCLRIQKSTSAIHHLGGRTNPE